jgi:hypothetical protein
MEGFMKEAQACDVEVGGTCWDFLVSVLRSAHPTGLGDSLRLTRVAEEYYRKANGNGSIGVRDKGR